MILFVFLLTAMVGAVGPPIIKYTVYQFSPIITVLLRSLLSILIIAPFVLKDVKRLKESRERKLLLIANILFAANWFFAAEGFKSTSLLMNQIIYSLVPVLVGILGYFFLKERVNKYQMIGLILGLAGMGVLIYSSLKTTDIISFGTLQGNIITVLGLFSWSTYMVVTRKISNDISPQAITLSNFVVCAILAFFIVAMLKITNFGFNFTAFTLNNTLGLIGLGLFSVSFFFLYQWLIKNASIFTSSLINYTGPVASVVTGPLFFNEKIYLNYVIGAVLILIGVFISTSFDYYNNNKVKKTQ